MEQLRNLPPGQNSSDWRNVWSMQQLLIKDRIQIDGQWFIVQREEEWVEGQFWHGQASIIRDTL
jgi:hypothetical protein